jgi:aspartate racemase
MKTVGIIGGIAPASTIEYYRSIIALYRTRKPDDSYPPIIINSIDMTKMLGLIGAQKLEEVTGYLLGEVFKLARAGAELGLFASNTPHLVFDEIQQQSPIPMISIVEAACRAAEALGLKKVGLFGTRFTMQARFYPDVFSRKGITVMAPDSGDQDYIHDKYMNELVIGVYGDETRGRLLSIVDRLVEQHQIQGLILGGTELPFILRDMDARKIPFLDTTRIHVEQIVSHMLST